MKGISLIIATINRTVELQRLISSIVVESHTIVDLVIVDQNDDDRVKKILAEVNHPNNITIQYVHFNQRNQSLARNFGMRFIKFDIFAFPDDDCWYDQNTLNTVLSLFESNEDCDMIIGRWIENSDKAPSQPTKVSVKSLKQFRSIPISAITMFVKRSSINEVFFDERFGAYKENGGYFGSGEETDYLITLAKSNCTIKFFPNIIVHHVYRHIRFKSVKEQFLFSLHRDRGIGGLYAKHTINPYIIFRGFVAPIVKAFTIGLFSPTLMAMFFAQSIGRIQGYISWNRKYISKKDKIN